MTPTLLSPAMKKHLAEWLAKWRGKNWWNPPPGWRFVIAGFMLAGMRTAGLYLMAGALAWSAWWIGRMQAGWGQEAESLLAGADQALQKKQAAVASRRDLDAARELAEHLEASGFTAFHDRLDLVRRLAAISGNEGRKDFAFEVSRSAETPIPDGEGATLLRSEVVLRFKARDPMRIADLPGQLAKLVGPYLLLESVSITVDKKALAALEDDPAAAWPLDSELRFGWIAGKIGPAKSPDGTKAATPDGPLALPLPPSTKGPLT